MEYLLWAELGAPREDLRLEWFVSGTPSARYEASTFSPCAVICEGCPTEWTVIRGLPLQQKKGNVWLFMRADESLAQLPASGPARPEASRANRCNAMRASCLPEGEPEAESTRL
jgi:hypothetical protein